MAFDFPASPTDGTQFAPPGGPQYVYQSPAWRMVSTASTVLTAETRNRIVNGAMQIQQDAGMVGGYVADQWSLATSIAAATVSRASGPTPYGSVYLARLYAPTPKGSLAATDFHGFLQSIEGTRVADFQWGTAAAKQVVLRFCFWATVAGTYSIAIGNGAANRSYVDTFVVTAGQVSTYQYYTFVIPGDVTGTWPKDNTKSVEVSVTPAAGSNYQTATKGWQAGNRYVHTSGANNVASANDCYLSDVGLYLDPDRTGVPPKWTMPDEAEELRACQRYYAKTKMLFTPVANTNQGRWPDAMRTNPALSYVAEGGTGATIASLSSSSPPYMGFYQAAAHTTANAAVITGNARM